MSDENDFDLNEFDYIAGAIATYCMSKKMTKEDFWNIINHVEDGYEFELAVEAQEWLQDVVDYHYEMKRYSDEKDRY